MQFINGKPLLSATDLMRFLGCRHAITLDLLYLEGKGPAKKADDPEAELLQRQGNEHEANHLAALKASGKKVREIDRGGRSLAQALVLLGNSGCQRAQAQASTAQAGHAGVAGQAPPCQCLGQWPPASSRAQWLARRPPASASGHQRAAERSTAARRLPAPVVACARGQAGTNGRPPLCDWHWQPS